LPPRQQAFLAPSPIYPDGGEPSGPNAAGTGGAVTVTGSPSIGQLAKFAAPAVITGAVIGTDYAPATVGTSILRANGAGGFTNASAGVDYAPATPAGIHILKSDGAGGFVDAVAATDYAPATTGTSILKALTGGFANAVSGTDYAPATSGATILKGNGAGGFSNAVAGTDYAPATSGSAILSGNGAGSFVNVTIGSGVSFVGGTLSATGSGGSVTNVSSADTNLTVANPTTTPTLTIVASPKLATARTISYTGDATGGPTSFDGTSNISTALTLANTAVTGGTYGDATHVGQFTVDAKGRITAAAAIAIAVGTVTNVSSADANLTVANPTTTPTLTVVASPKLATARTLSYTGDATGGPTSFDGTANISTALTLAASGVSAATYGDGNNVGQVTVNAKGLVTAASNVKLTGTSNRVQRGNGNGGFTPADSVPDATTYTWVNQGGSSFSQFNVPGSVLAIIAPNSSLNWRGLFHTQPSTPYKVQAQIRVVDDGVNTQVSGIYFYDGTKLMGLEVETQTGLSIATRVEKITNVNTDNSTAKTFTGYASGPFSVSWFQLRNDGSTLFFDYSADGSNFFNLFSEAIGTFITPTQFGYGGANVTASGILHLWVMNLATYGNANLNGQ